MHKKWMIHAFGGLLLFSTAGAAVFLAYDPFALLVLAAAGQIHDRCTLREALEFHRTERAKRLAADKAQVRLIERDTAGFGLWETPRGRIWSPSSSEQYLGFAEARFENVKGAVRPGDIVIDAGGHLGTSTLAALRMGARLVLVIEPAPDNLACLRRNLADEIAAGRVLLYEGGVWDRDAFLAMHLHDESSAAHSVAEGGHGDGPVVELTTIDKLVEKFGLERVDFIKMDIEGAEQRALAGARGTIGRFHPRMAVGAYHAADDDRRIPDIIREAWPDYRMECSRCSIAYGEIRPAMLYFH